LAEALDGEADGRGLPIRAFFANRQGQPNATVDQGFDIRFSGQEGLMDLRPGL
jgi:hypothetical protein